MIDWMIWWVVLFFATYGVLGFIHDVIALFETRRLKKQLHELLQKENHD